MTDRQHGRVSRVGSWLVSSPEAIWFLLVVYTFGVYEVLGFEVAVIMTLLLMLRVIIQNDR